MNSNWFSRDSSETPNLMGMENCINWGNLSMKASLKMTSLTAGVLHLNILVSFDRGYTMVMEFIGNSKLKINSL